MRNTFCEKCCLCATLWGRPVLITSLLQWVWISHRGRTCGWALSEMAWGQRGSGRLLHQPLPSRNHTDGQSVLNDGFLLVECDDTAGLASGRFGGCFQPLYLSKAIFRCQFPAYLNQAFDSISFLDKEIAFWTIVVEIEEPVFWNERTSHAFCVCGWMITLKLDKQFLKVFRYGKLLDAPHHMRKFCRATTGAASDISWQNLIIRAPQWNSCPEVIWQTHLPNYLCPAIWQTRLPN